MVPPLSKAAFYLFQLKQKLIIKSANIIINNLFMNKALFLTLLLSSFLIVLHNSNSDAPSEFQKWKRQFKVSFSSESDEFYRRNIFYMNLGRITKHNDDPSSTYKMGVNQFTIYTEEQFQERFLAVRIKGQGQGSIGERDGVKAVQIDWQKQGAVGPVRNQGAAGSASLFATLGVTQGLSKVTKGTLQQFSVGQLMDCVYRSGGGFITDGYQYYKKHSVCTEQEYPSSGKPQTCQDKQCKFKISGYQVVKDCAALKNAMSKQPIAVAVDASKWSAYASGIFSNCGTSLNHVVLLTVLADEYWKCQNSWGTAWGEFGYIRLAPGNTCGICSYASYPTA